MSKLTNKASISGIRPYLMVYLHMRLLSSCLLYDLKQKGQVFCGSSVDCYLKKGRSTEYYA